MTDPVHHGDESGTEAERLATLIIELRRSLRRANVRREPLSSGDESAVGDARRSDAAAGARTLTQSHSEVVRYVASHPGVGTTTIAANLHLSANTVSTLCSSLVAAGSLRRDVDPDDRRAARFFLTEKQERLRSEKIDHRSEAISMALLTMDDDSRADLIRALPALEQLANILDDIGLDHRHRSP